MNTCCALAGVDTGMLKLSGSLDAVTTPAMREVLATAKGDEFGLSEAAINNAIHSDDGGWSEPSMLRDVKKDNLIELEVIFGNVRVAEKLKVKTPSLSLLYELLSAVHFKLKEGEGYF